MNPCHYPSSLFSLPILIVGRIGSGIPQHTRLIRSTSTEAKSAEISLDMKGLVSLKLVTYGIVPAYLTE